jgi:ethanolamine utilization microcompartment shell protein EutL
VERKNAIIKKKKFEAVVPSVDEELIAFCKMTPSFRSLGG